jgi:hypothetical protein
MGGAGDIGRSLAEAEGRETAIGATRPYRARAAKLNPAYKCG